MRAISSDRVSLTEQVFEELRKGVVTGELAPGSLHSIIDMAAQLNVSRTPVREAVLKLASIGMVRIERSRGFRILRMSPKDIEEIHSFRIMLEVPSAYRAAGRISAEQLDAIAASLKDMRKACESGNEHSFQEADNRFHELILEAAGNERVTQAVHTMRSQLSARGLSTTDRRTLWDILAVHERIFQNLQAKDEQGTADAMRNHLNETAQLLLAQASDGEAGGESYDPPVVDPAGLWR